MSSKKVTAYVANKTPLDVSKFLIGKEVTITNNSSNHNYGAIGTKFKVEVVTNYNGNMAVLKNALPSYGFTYINFNDIELPLMTIEELNEMKADNDKSIAEFVKENADIDNKISFMNQYELKEFDEDLYKVNSVLTTLDKEMSNIEKAKLIAHLIKN